MGAQTPTAAPAADGSGRGQTPPPPPPPPPRRSRAALYLPLPDGQERAKVALASLEGFAHAQGCVVAGRYLEPPDGGRSRAKLKRLLRRARTKVFEAVCVLRLDDLAASRPGAARVAWELDEVGVRVVSTSEPQLDLRAPALRWIAEDQPRRSQRVKDALQAKRARGKRMGAVPRGFRLALDGVRQEPDETEQTVIKQAVALSKSGASLSSIARRLTEQGYRSRNGTPFSHNQISRMLARVRGDQQSMP